MTLTQMTYFDAVCKYKNVTKAADSLFVSRSAVSRALKELESEWNLVLFKRSRTGVELTEDGVKIREMFSEFNRAYSTLKKSILDTKRTAGKSELHFGITTTTGSRFFPDFFPGFKKIHPEIRLCIREHPIYECMEALTSGDCDFFITPHINKEVGQADYLEKKLLYDSEMVFCVSSDHPLAKNKTISISQLKGIDRASLLTPLTFDIIGETFLGSLLDCDDDEEIILKTSQQELIHKAIASNFVTAFLPLDMVQGWENVSPISLDPVSHNSVYMVWNKNASYSDACSLFIEYIRHYDFSKL